MEFQQSMQPHSNDIPYDNRPFDMSQLMAAMPHGGDSIKYQHPRPPVHGLGVSSPMFYPTHRTAQYADTRNLQDGDLRWTQQAAPPPAMNGGAGIYNAGWNGPLGDTRTALPSLFGTRSFSQNGTPPKPREFQPTAVPSNPRGPPRKPKRSGHALWVGNLPPFAKIEELKDHFSAGAKQDIESVFLISKSNCAFVNYRSEAACVSAMNRFHNSRFRGRSLVCRLRRTTSSSSATMAPVAIDGLHSPTDEVTSPSSTDHPASPLIVGGNEDSSNLALTPSPTDSSRSVIPAKYFILKSLTLEDLEASVVTRSWATQPHNVDLLNAAFAEADNVYLIFSANKSGEYFGYARMVSSSNARTEESPALDCAVDSGSSDSPRTIPTFATATAPRGRIIDDSARGSIFWEADHSDESNDMATGRAKAGETAGNGRFAIEWVSTMKLPFYQTRGMRNPWNGNREIKIARDGQELDPRIGRRLLQLFQSPPSSSSIQLDGI